MRISTMIGLVLAIAPAVAGAARPDLRNLDLLPLHSAPAVAKSQLSGSPSDSKGLGPALFAVTVPLPMGLGGGVWDGAAADDMLRWRTRVYSAEAKGLILYFSEFRLPEGAELRVYDPRGDVVRGPYTRADEAEDLSLWTAEVSGDTAVVELIVPASRQHEVRLGLARLGHAYKHLDQLGESGGCEIDQACPLGDDWRDEADATVKLQVPVGFGLYVGLCTGTLVNNTAQDDRPLVLTASHCGIGDPGSPPSGVVVYWNFRNTMCNVDDAGVPATQTGATLRARDRNTDLALIELNRRPPSGVNPYFAGWDASGYGGAYGVGVHHPSGDAKKVSAFDLPLTPIDVKIDTLGPAIPAWKVERWSQGSTEPGSSGSGLWNEQHRLVGVLSGGRASCSGLLATSQPDFYARLDRQWVANADVAGQLKAWLDPVAGECLAIAGKRPGARAVLDCRAASENGAASGGGGAVPLSLVLTLLLLASCRIPRRSRSG